MALQSFQALVVDDDPIARKTIGFALCEEGFSCAYASDGNEALNRLAAEPFDIVVTDLRMPNRHGYSLAVELLSRQQRPLIVVHSSVDDPRLAKDLMLQGVDDIVYKPTNYSAFAAKALGMVSRSRQAIIEKNRVVEAAVEAAQSEASESGSATQSDNATVCASDKQSLLSDHSKVLAISHAALDVCEMVETGSFNAEQVATAIQRDPALAAKVLQLANSPYYNSTGKPIKDFNQAVVRIGQKRVGEFALALSAFASIKPETLPWMDLDLAWRRSVAAGIAVEILVAQGGHADVSQGLIFSALMHSSGRMALGTHYPQQYKAMVRRCTETEEALLLLESRVFSASHAEALCELLTDWNIPSPIFQPLKYALHDYSKLSTMPEPMRTKSELVKLAILVGQIPVGKWENWDLIDLPPESVLDRLHIVDIGATIRQVESQIQGIAGFSSSVKMLVTKSQRSPPIQLQLAYCNLSGEPFDFLPRIVPSMGIRLCPVDLQVGKVRGSALVNRIGAVPEKSTYKLFEDCNEVVFVRDSANLKDADKIGSNISVPCSYAALRSACCRAVQ